MIDEKITPLHGLGNAFHIAAINGGRHVAPLFAVLNLLQTVPSVALFGLLLVLQSGGSTVKPIAMDEWNIFAVNSKQPVSHINGLHADLVLGEALKNKYGEESCYSIFLQPKLTVAVGVRYKHVDEYEY